MCDNGTSQAEKGTASPEPPSRVAPSEPPAASGHPIPADPEQNPTPSVDRSENHDLASLAFTHEPTGERVMVTGSTRSIDIIRDLILKAATK